MSARAALHFVAGGLLVWWLDGKARLAPEALDDMFQQLVRNGLARPDMATDQRAGACFCPSFR